MKIYIAGPMTGLPELNFPAFFEAEKQIIRAGHTPINPARNPPNLEYEEYVEIALILVRASNAITLLSGWEKSPGANVEYYYAKSLGRGLYSL